jgi:hypothetical protein
MNVEFSGAKFDEKTTVMISLKTELAKALLCYFFPYEPFRIVDFTSTEVSINH